MNRKSYWTVLREDIFKNRILLLAVCMTAILSFGFTVTNYSIGVDDPMRDYYLYSQNYGNMVQQGRLTQLAINFLTNSVDFIPFFTEFTGAALFTLSALLFCGLFQYVTDGRFSTLALAAFSCIYLSYPITADKFLYHLDVIAVMVSYCCTALSLMYAYRFIYQEKNRKNFAAAALLLMTAAGSYESFLFLYFCGVFGLFLLRLVIRKESLTFRQILLEGLQYAAILLTAMAVYYLLVFLLQLITGQLGQFSRIGNLHQEGAGLVQSLIISAKSTLVRMLDLFVNGNLAVREFAAAGILGSILFLVLAVKRRNAWIFLCFLALAGGNLLIFLFLTTFITRAAQTFCFFLGFLALMLVWLLDSIPALRKVLILLLVLLTVRQAADMNRSFFTDYTRYQQEVYTIHTVANRLIGGFDISKPVIFTNEPEFQYLQAGLHPATGQDAGVSMIYWSLTTGSERTQYILGEIFKLHGYDFLVSPTPEQCFAALELSQDMACWPHRDSIQEFDNFIIVNFG